MLPDAALTARRALALSAESATVPALTAKSSTGGSLSMVSVPVPVFATRAPDEACVSAFPETVTA